MKLMQEMPVPTQAPTIREPGKISEVKEVAKQFESLMMHEVFKAMRRTVEACKGSEPHRVSRSLQVCLMKSWQRYHLRQAAVVGSWLARSRTNSCDLYCHRRHRLRLES